MPSSSSRHRTIGVSALVAVAVLVVGVAVVGVGDLGGLGRSSTSGGADEAGDAETGGASAALPSCADERNVVVFDIFNMLTMGAVGGHEIITWIQDPSDEPDLRPGAVELVQLYRRLGYEIMYVHAAPSTIVIGGQPLEAAIAGWLERSGFPVGDGVHFFTWTPASAADDSETTPLTVMSEALVQLGIEAVDVRFGYSGITGRVEAFIAGGIPADRVFTLGEAAVIEGTEVIPGGNLNAHVGLLTATVDPVCEPR